MTTASDTTATLVAAAADISLPLDNTDRHLLALSDLLTSVLRANCQDAASLAMVPSYLHALPTGRERGTVLAIDLGGSTLRVAVVAVGPPERTVHIVMQRTWAVTPDVKQLAGLAFFDWMAARILEAIAAAGAAVEAQARSPAGFEAGLVWSFPLKQTSLDNGVLELMGKGFDQDGTLRGKDMKSCLGAALEKLNLHIHLAAILNDSVSVLVSQAYACSSTRFGLVAGTGYNGSVHLPLTALGAAKFGDRAPDWNADSRVLHVLVDAELCIAGLGSIPMTRWDRMLEGLIPPGYGGVLEQFIGALYLAELVRLIVVQAIRTDGFFGGNVPGGGFADPLGFHAALMAAFEEDDSPALDAASAAFLAAHPLPTPPPAAEWQALHGLCVAVSTRAAAYIALGLHALWRVRHATTEMEEPVETTWTVGCGGAMVEKYVGVRERVQGFLDRLTALSISSDDSIANTQGRRLVLEVCADATIQGAAIAAVMGRCERGLEPSSLVS